MLKRTTAGLLIAALPVVALAHGGTHKKVVGTISKVETTKLHITTKDAHDSDVTITSKTKFMLNKRAKTIQSGKTCTVRYQRTAPHGRRVPAVRRRSAAEVK